MSRSIILCCAILGGAVVPVSAQQHADHHPAANAVATQRQLWTDVTQSIRRAAEQMPEADYAYRPVESVRTFGQLIGHIAGAQNHMCGTALAEEAGGEDDVEKSTTTKAALLEALEASTAVCERAYAQSDAEAAGAITMYGRNRTRLYALGMNTLHNGEHYGNIVTYLRMKGMVPPSSQ
jgi:uncharacterized damage-inducible protein DinB